MLTESEILVDLRVRIPGESSSWSCILSRQLTDLQPMPAICEPVSMKVCVGTNGVKPSTPSRQTGRQR
jgi:hypothetical protein